MENSEFVFFNDIAEDGNVMDVVSTKCFVYTLLEEMLRLKCITLDERIRYKLGNIIEAGWRDKYIRE